MSRQSAVGSWQLAVGSRRVCRASRRRTDPPRQQDGATRGRILPPTAYRLVTLPVRPRDGKPESVPGLWAARDGDFIPAGKGAADQSEGHLRPPEHDDVAGEEDQ